MNDLSHRSFVKGAALGVAAMVAAPAARGSANERIRVAVIGIRSRGGDHLEGLLAPPNLEVAPSAMWIRESSTRYPKSFLARRTCRFQSLNRICAKSLKTILSTR